MNFAENGKLVRIGVIGLGGRGNGWVNSMARMGDVEVTAVCDVYEDRVERAKKTALDAQGKEPFGTTDYHDLFGRDDVDALLVITNWESHIRIAIECIKADVPVGMEVGCAASIQECWDLVHAWEEHRTPFMLLENCCFGRNELATLNMARKGLFGELVHLQGGYQHDLRDEIGNGDVNRHYRQGNFFNRNGELYPTHELGPMAMTAGINRGNRMLTLCSMASKAAGLRAWFRKNRPDTNLPEAQVNMGDIVTTIIKCAGGETMVLTHDCTCPRPYSRGQRIDGTNGIYMEDKNAVYLEECPDELRSEKGFVEHEWEDFAEYLPKVEHPLWKEFIASGREGSHGGMDYLEARAFVDMLRDGTPSPIDVYDAASWLCISALSEQSVAMGGMPVPIPDFTNGEWIRRKSEDFFGL